ncbi:hypothetical protein [Fodinicurvata sp. EGI_FJ10296]|uniref:hypothetical protein n=1 Tax=Fodinicurvata sp. EGI_FJ10296 TaxID=3231908 RepID=UPI0034539EF5
MTLGLHDPDRRYRRRLRSTVLKLSFYLVTVGAIGVFTYQIGVEQVESRERQLRDQISRLQEQQRALEQTAVQAQAAARTAEARYEEAADRLAREVPTGELRALMQLVSDRLNEDVPADRLAFFIEAAEEARDCTDPITRRFIMPTPVYQGANTSVSFADGRISVTGMGQSATSDGGAQQPWFDPGQEVTLRFATVGGEETTATGTLPVHQSVVLGDREYRFTAVEGDERSFVQVTSDNCPFPG